MSDLAPKPEGVEPLTGPYAVDRCGPLLLVSTPGGMTVTCGCGSPACPAPASLRALQMAQPMYLYLSLYARGLAAALEANPDDARAPRNREVLAMVEGILRFVRTGDTEALTAASKAVIAASPRPAMPCPAGNLNPARN